MNLSVLWISLGSMGVCAYLALGLWHLGQVNGREFREVSRQVLIAQEGINHMVVLPDQEPFVIEEGYQRFYETARGAARLTDTKFMVELPTLKESQQVKDAIIPSHFIGVNALRIKLTFSEVAFPDGHTKILKIFGDLQKVLPMEIKRIDVFDKNIEMAIDLLGQARRG